MEIAGSFISSSVSISLIVHVLLLSSPLSVHSFALPSTVAYGGIVWINNNKSLDSWTPQSDGTGALTVRPILLTDNTSYNGENLRFGCGFFCYAVPCDTGYNFAAFFVLYETNFSDPDDLQMVWTANRERLVKENATLELTSSGDLVLKDSDGTVVWSTNTFTKDFQGMRIEESGNLVLLNRSNGTMWESFDHPTDLLMSGQRLEVGQKLTANISPTNTSPGTFYGTLVRDGFAMFTATTPPQMYFKYPPLPPAVNFAFIQFDTNYLLYYSEGSLSNPSAVNLSVPHNALYLKISCDGHLRFFSYDSKTGRSDNDYLSQVTGALTRCDYPTVCGDYGICTDNQCSCPKTENYFYQIDNSNPSLGCSPYNPVPCSGNDSKSGQSFLELDHVSYFSYMWEKPSILDLVSGDYCKYLCSINCSCKASFFRYGFTPNSSLGYCYLKSSVLSMELKSKTTDFFYNSTAYLKVQSKSKRPKYLIAVISVSAACAAIALFLLLWACKHKLGKARKEEEKDEDLDLPAGFPVRYSFQELKNATNDFSMRLGGGGFGSVYEGILLNGTKIAVKRLDGAGQGSREFHAEVETLGHIHHVNLVRLEGFCAEKSHRIIVYEYLPNGSLDKWIFPKENPRLVLDWKTRSKVILHIARGLSYLHEECRDRIIHFDIKPQNILLDENFNAKVSDFGLAKLINREQSEVITMLRGTPGYMAPELLGMHFTEKADVYGFGVMVVEIVSGKKSRELTTPSYGLFSVLQGMAEEGRLKGLVDPEIKDEGIGAEQEATNVLAMGICCIQYDFTARPTMSTLVKALENPSEMDYVTSVFTGSPMQPLVFFEKFNDVALSYGPLPSELSGPR